MNLSNDSILDAAGSEATNLGSSLYIVFPRGSEAIPSNLKVIPEFEFDQNIYNFYSIVHPHESRLVVERREVGIMAVHKETNRVRSGTKGGAQGHLYKSLALAKAAVAYRNKVEDYNFYMAYIEVPIDTSS